MNITRTHVFGFVGLVGFAGALYWAKAEAQAKREQVSVLRAQVDAERRAVRTLEAEAAWLERPDRIEASAKRGLSMDVVPAGRIATMAEIDQVAPLPAVVVAASPDTETAAIPQKGATQ